jgi:hypothetical protein
MIPAYFRKHTFVGILGLRNLLKQAKCAQSVIYLACVAEAPCLQLHGDTD